MPRRLKLHGDITQAAVNIGFDVFDGLCFSVFLKGEGVAPVVCELLEPEVPERGGFIDVCLLLFSIHSSCKAADIYFEAPILLSERS